MWPVEHTDSIIIASACPTYIIKKLSCTEVCVYLCEGEGETVA